MREPNVKINVGKDEPIEKAIRRFKKLCDKVGIKKELKARNRFEKPGEVRRREERKADRNRRKALKKTEENTKHPSNSARNKPDRDNG